MKTSYWINIVLISWTFHTFYYIFEVENRPRLYLIVLSSKNNIHSTFIFRVYIIDFYQIWLLCIVTVILIGLKIGAIFKTSIIRSYFYDLNSTDMKSDYV